MAGGEGADEQGSGGLEGRSFSVSLTVNDLEESRRFYEALGFEVLEEGEVDGEVRFFMLKAGQAHIGIGQDDWAKGRDRVKGVGLRFWVTTDQDVEALAREVTAAGIEIEGPEELPWGPLAFAVTDPDGFKLTVAEES